MATGARLKFPSLRKDDIADRSKPLEFKHLDEIFKRIGKVVMFLSNPKLCLEIYQPFILETLPDASVKLRQVWTHYESQDRHLDLTYNEYFRTFLESLDAKVRELKQLCKQNKSEMYNSSSKARIVLVRASMTLSYLFKDFKVFFPGNEFSDHFRITKHEAADWWSRNFGNRVLVPWHEFQYRFGSEHSVTSYEEAICLKRDIDITVNDYVSKFEFDVFTRLFTPWGNILNTWRMLAVKHPAYVNMTYEEVKKCLEELVDRPASYLFRRSCTKLGFWSIGFVSHSRRVNQTVIRDGKSIVEALLEGFEQSLYVFPKGMEPSAAPDLRFLLTGRADESIAVTAEEFEIYSSMDSSFELCKICSEKNKDLKLEPCGHLLCRSCFKDWSLKLNRSDKTSNCPFCRAEIRSTETVRISPFRPAGAAAAASAAASTVAVVGTTFASTVVASAELEESKEERRQVGASPAVGELIDFESPPPLPLRSCDDASGRGRQADPFDVLDAESGNWANFDTYDIPRA